MPSKGPLERLDGDLACAIALGCVEHPQVVVTLNGITLHDERMRVLDQVNGWLRDDDPLHVATKQYLLARQEVSRAGMNTRPGYGWAAASQAKIRDTANQRALQAKGQAQALLEERGVFARARAAGLRVLE